MRKKHPGSYILTHIPTGHFYVGSASCVKARMQQHKHTLNKGNHANRRLQQIFTKWEDLQIDITLTNTVDDARREEQDLLDTHSESELLCNVSTSATNSFQGVLSDERRKEILLMAIAASSLARRGKPQTEDHIRNAVEGRRGFTQTDKSREAISLTKSKKVSIDGVIYDSSREAAKALNLPFRTLRSRLYSDSKKFKHYFFIP